MKKIYTMTIRTSGYSDRYLHTDLRVQDGPAEFHDPEGHATYMSGLGYDYETAWDKAHNAPSVYIMRGKISQTAWKSLEINSDERRSIHAFLLLRGRLGTYTAEAIENAKAQLKNHPLTGDLLEIVKYQLRQCDISNIETWGSADGREINHVQS